MEVPLASLQSSSSATSANMSMKFLFGSVIFQTTVLLSIWDILAGPLVSVSGHLVE